MSSVFLLQMIMLLFLGQLLLGGIGWLLVGAAPWAGLPVTLVLIWFIRRTAHVFREEIGKAARRDARVQPKRLAIYVAFGAQALGFALLPYWAPDWILLLWQGAVLPVAETLASFWPAAQALHSWLWVAAFLEMALFAWTAAIPQRVTAVSSTAPVKTAPGEWAAARRLSEVNRRGRRVR